MTTQLKIWIALAVTVVAVFGAVWQIANVRGMKARGRRRTRESAQAQQQQGQGGAAQRRSDARVLKGPEKRLYNESQKLLAQGKIASAARILEQLNMPREAIQALEDHGMIHEAAKILMRMQRHNRAGVVYARHGMWDNAAQCFKMANMPLEVAKCSREAGNLAVAAEYFEKVGRFEDAAECHEALGDFHKAARHFSSAGQKPKAMAMYNRLAQAAQNLSALEFDDDEMEQIVGYLADGHTDEGLAALAVNRNKLTEVVINLCAKGLVKQASELFLRANADIGPMLMAEVNYQNRSAPCLAEVFLNVSQFHYAGMVYERMNTFDRAGEAFERAEDFERAAYCFERAGVDHKVRLLKEKAKASPYKGSVRGGAANFALANVGQSELAPVASSGPKKGASDGNSFGEGDDESTAVIDMGKKGAPPPPPRPAEPRAAEPPRAPELPPRPVERVQFPAAAPISTPAAAPAPAAKFALGPDDDDDAAPPDDSPVDAQPPMPVSAAREAATEDDDAPALPDPVTLDDGRAMFHKAKFFADLDFDQKNKLWNVGKTLDLDAEETVLTYNDEPRGVYVIIQGSVSCFKLMNGKEAYVDQMGETESFGELWLLADQPTSVRFVASKNTKIRVIDREAFNDLLDKDGTIARKLYKRFTMRLLKRLLKPQNSSKNQQAS